MTAIAITDDGQVTIDGQLAGRVADTIANNPKLASDIQRAYDEWHPAIFKRAADALAAAQQKASDDLTALQAKLDDALKAAAVDKEQALVEQKATSDQQMADLKAQVTDLTTKLGTLPQFIDDLKAAAGGEDKVQSLIDDYKQQQAKQTALAQGGAVIDQLMAIGLSPDEISQAVAAKLTAMAQTAVADTPPKT